MTSRLLSQADGGEKTIKLIHKSLILLAKNSLLARQIG